MTHLARNAIVGILITLSFFLSPSLTFASSLSSSSYTYDNIGNIQSITDSVGGITYSYTYDDLYRLSGVTGGYSAGYSYDRDGNILTKTEGPQTVSETYTPGSTSTHAPKSVNGKILKYDLNGNLIEDAFSNLKITYDYDNRPIQITDTSKQITAKYYYDGEGKRVKKETYTNNTLSKTTEYINQYYEKETPFGQAPLVRKFYAGTAYRENNTLTYTATDHLSSTTLLTNSSGGKQGEYRYYPYGNPIQITTTLPPNSWIGQKRDDESGLYFLNARYYSPTYGRFVSVDPAIDPASRGNNFVYSANNPVDKSDPGGMMVADDSNGGGNANRSWCGLLPCDTDASDYAAAGGMALQWLGDQFESGIFSHGLLALSWKGAGWEQEMMAKGVDFDTGGPDGGPLMNPYLEQAAMTIAMGSTGGIGTTGIVTKVYRYERGVLNRPPSWDLHSFQNEVIEYAKRGEFENAWNCVNAACQKIGVGSVVKERVLDSDGLEVAGLSTNPIQIATQQNGYRISNWNMLNNYAHEAGHLYDHRVFRGISSAQSEARQQYFSSRFSAAIGDTYAANFRYMMYWRIAEGYYPPGVIPTYR